MTSVHVLFDGFSQIIDDKTMLANCTCTLITTKNLAIIIDTMTAWDRDKILDELKKHDLTADEINYVICTHSHADHIGNNNLFLNAEHIVGLSANFGEKFYEKNIKKEPYVLCDTVKIIATPGHTAEDVSVLVEVEENKKIKRFAVVGDLYEKQEDISDPKLWQDLGTAELQNLQAQMRWKILNHANVIIPGHGPMFNVTENMKEIMRKQLEQGGLSTNITL